MAGLTQADVTPVIPQDDAAGLQEEEKKEGYDVRRWLTNPGNEIKWLWNKANETVQTLNSNVDRTGRIGTMRYYYDKDDPETIRFGAMPAQKEAVQGAVESTIDVALSAQNVVQNVLEGGVAAIQGREPQPQAAADTTIGGLLTSLKESSANALGVPQRWELEEDDRWLRDAGSVATSAILANYMLGSLKLTPGANPQAFTGMRLTNGQLAKVKGPWGAYWRANPQWAQAAARWLSYGGSESFLTTMISDQRDTGNADPKDDRLRASVKSLIPNAGEELAIGGSLLGLSKLAQKFLGGRSGIARNNKAWRTVDEVENARAWAESSGIQQRTDEGSYEFIAEDPWETGPVTAEQVAANIDETATPANPRAAADRMTAEPPEDFWDPAAPEVDTVIRGIDELEDADLQDLLARVANGEDGVQVLGEKLNRVDQPTPDVEVGPPTAPRADMPVPEDEMFASLDLAQLRSISKIDARVQAELARVGVSPVKATRREVIDAILSARSKGVATASPAAVPENAMPAVQRNEMKKQIVTRMVQERQVRPSATEVPELPTRTTKDPAEMTPAEFIGEETRLAGEYQAMDNAKAERILRETREATGYYEMTPEQQAANGKFDGWEDKPAAEPAPEEPSFVLPATVAKSSPRFGMAQLKFESDLDKAAYIIRNKAKKSKGEDRIIKALKEQGFDIDEVRALGDQIKTQIQDGLEQTTRSRKAPSEAMTIEIPSSQGADETVDSLGEEFVWTNNGLEMQEKLTKLMKARSATMQEQVEKIVEQIFGPGNTPDLRFRDDKVRKLKSRDWGGDGKKMGVVNGYYSPIEDVIAIHALTERKYDQIRTTAFHEAWHRIQYGYLNTKELKVLDSVFGKSDLQNLSGFRMGGPVKPIEMQAVAFQTYALARQKGETRLGIIRDAILDMLEEQFPGAKKDIGGRLTANALALLQEGWEKIMAFANRVGNYVQGNGFQNVYDIFEEAWSGRMGASRRFDGFMQALNEANAVTEESFNKMIDEGTFEAFDDRMNLALDRNEYWDKWRGRGNSAVNQLNGEIAALKQQALAGGC